MAKSPLMVTRVASRLGLSRDVRDHRPALHDHGDRVIVHVPNGLCRGRPRNTNGMSTKQSQRRWPSPQSKQSLSQEYGWLQLLQ